MSGCGFGLSAIWLVQGRCESFCLDLVLCCGVGIIYVLCEFALFGVIGDSLCCAGGCAWVWVWFEWYLAGKLRYVVLLVWIGTPVGLVQYTFRWLQTAGMLLGLFGVLWLVGFVLVSLVVG